MALKLTVEENEKLKAEIEMLNACIVDQEKIDLHIFSTILNMLPEPERKVLSGYIVKLEVENTHLKSDLKDAIEANEALHEEVGNYHNAIEEAWERYPYKVPGRHETYSDYNQGWQAAVDFISTVSEDGEKLEG
jgi:regulator of replication initiation timing